MAGVTDLVIWLVVRYTRGTRYPDGGGLDAAERAQGAQGRTEAYRLAVCDRDGVNHAPPLARPSYI